MEIWRGKRRGKNREWNGQVQSEGITVNLSLASHIREKSCAVTKQYFII